MTMHPDPWPPRHAARVQWHVEQATPKPKHDDDGALVLAAYAVVAACAVFGGLAYVGLRLLGVV